MEDTIFIIIIKINLIITIIIIINIVKNNNNNKYNNNNNNNKYSNKNIMSVGLSVHIYVIWIPGRGIFLNW